MSHEHNQLSKEQILELVKKNGFIGRHRYKCMNRNINKKLRSLVKEKILVEIRCDSRFSYFCLPNKIPKYLRNAPSEESV